MSNLPFDENRLAKVHSMKHFRGSIEFEAVERLRSNMSNNVAYKKAYDLFLRVSALIERVERTMEKAMVANLSNACMEMLITLYKMDMSSDKARYLADACEKIEVVEMLLKLVKEFKLIAVFYISDLEDHITQLSRLIYDEFNIDPA
jgi:hypothetical protein